MPENDSRFDVLDPYRQPKRTLSSMEGPLMAPRLSTGGFPGEGFALMRSRSGCRHRRPARMEPAASASQPGIRALTRIIHEGF